MPGALEVAVVATLDTKSAEAGLLVDLLRRRRASVRLVDTGILGEPNGVVPDVRSEEVANAAGVDLTTVRNMGSRGDAVATIARGLSVLLPREYAAGRFERAIAIGGLNGALMGAAGLRALPFGVPKLIVTPLASGTRTFGPFVGTSDIAVLHSVVDLQGVNRFTRTILDEAAMMITGSRVALPELPPSVGAVAITLNGNTTPVGMQVLRALERSGWEVVAFHSNGTGGSAMERLAADGSFDAIIDLTTNELVERELHGSFQVPESRMRLVADAGLPTVFLPGCMDFICLPPEALATRLGGRRHTRHSPGLELVRVTRDEAVALAEVFADSVRQHAGPTEVVVPLQGFSPSAGPGGPLEDVAADQAFVQTLQARLAGTTQVTLVDAPINDDEVADAIVQAFERVVSARPAATGVEGG